MKKTIFIVTLALVASVSLSAKKDKKLKVAEPAPVEVKQPVVLTSTADSLSYAAGQTHTMGMLDYVIGQLKVDTAYMADFIDGLRTRLNAVETPQLKAHAAGEQIASMVAGMMDNLNTQLDGSSTPLNKDLFKRGFVDAVEQDAQVLSVEESQKYFNTNMEKARLEKQELQKKEGREWLEQNKTKEGVQVTESGLQYRIIKAGNGPVATADKDVVVKYEGRLIDGTIFDSSYERNPQTTTFKPSQVIKGWTEALCMMPQGSEWELYIPENLGYGERQAGKIPPFSTLIFKVEVVEVK